MNNKLNEYRTQDSITTLGHELAYIQDQQDGTLKPGDKDQGRYANNYGKDIGKYTNFINTTFNNQGLAGTNPHQGNTDSELVKSNNQEFSKLDKSKGDDALETAWDVANVAIGVHSLKTNIEEGNYGAAAVDAVGVFFDGIATVVPFLPAGVSSLIKAGRVADDAIDAASNAAKVPPSNVDDAVHKVAGEVKGGVPKVEALNNNAAGLDKEIESIQNLGDPKANRLNTDRVRPVNGRNPINSQKYANTTIPLKDLPPEIATKYPKSVHFSGAGYPDFTPYAVRKTKIKMTGIRDKDFKLASQAVGLKSTPKGYTWHHHQESGVMQLIPTDLHKAVAHTGGVATSGIKPYN